MKQKSPVLILAAFVIFIPIFHLFAYTGHYGYDDLHYAKLAVQFLNGSLDFTDHYSFRTPVILLTALSYSVFGVNDFASSLPSMLISIGILMLVYCILKNKGILSLVIGLSLTTLTNWFIFYSDKLMPDMYVVLGIMGALVVIYSYKFDSSHKKPFQFSLLLIVSLLFGFMAKETIVLIIPLLLYLFGVDILYKRDVKFWMFTIINGTIILSLYFIIIGILTGNFLMRFEAIINNSYLNLCSYDQQPFLITLKRISYEFFNLILYQGMTLGYIFVIAYMIRKKSVKHFTFSDGFSFWMTSAILLLLSSNFMTISLTSYSPMCLDPRHYLFLIPVVAIATSLIIQHHLQELNFRIALFLLSLVVTIVSVFLQGDSFIKIYLPFTILNLLALVFPFKRSFTLVFLILFIGVLLIKPFYLITYSQKVKYRSQKEVFQTIVQSQKNCLIITDDVQKRLASYYSGFKPTSNEYVNFSQFRFDSTDTRKKIMFLNWHTMYLSGLATHDLPFYAKEISKNNRLLYEDKKIYLSIYEMNDFTIPEVTEKLILTNKNTFENQEIFWNQNPIDLCNKKWHSGSTSLKIGEYSATFSYPLDSLPFTNYHSILITCNLFCNFDDKTTSKMVVSLKSVEDTYLWESKDVNSFLKAYSKWWPVNYELSVETKQIKAGSYLQIYIWNPKKEQGYLDDFEIHIFGIN